MKTAILIGATGVTGKHVLEQLLLRDEYTKIIVFVRRTVRVKDPRLHVHVVDFDAMDGWRDLIRGDDLFSALGTTVKQAGGKAGQYKVDYQYQADVIAAAAANGVSRLFLVSSPQASPRSPIFYNRMKGRLDHFAAQQGFDTVVYFKPSIIEGDRPDSRPGEKIGAVLVGAVAHWIPGASGLRPISGEQLAAAIVNCACSPLASGKHCYELGEIFTLLDD
tara:strand:+ start:89260 stop:89919 length:660 start_codon:yes stop_codon:yes gene_type:complete